MQSVSISDLLEGCRKGRPSAQRSLYEGFAGLLFAIARRYGADRMQAEDMHQLGFVRAFERIAQCKATTRPELEAWLRRVMVTTCLNELARHKRHKVWLNQVPEEAEDPIAPGEPQIGHLDTEFLQSLVEALPDGARIIFNLFAVEGYTHAEIAASLSITESASRAQLTRARKLLRDKLASHPMAAHNDIQSV